MLKISSSWLSDSSTRSSIYSLPDKIAQRIYKIGKKVFHYLYWKRYAFAVSLWSYLFIEVGIVACQSAFGEEYVKDINSCEKVLCNHWNSHIEHRNAFPPLVQSRCDSSNSITDSLPLYSFNTCMNDLCEYMKNMGKHVYACAANFDQSNTDRSSGASSQGIFYSNEFTYQIWNRLCPKRETKDLTINQQAAYINECLNKLCADSVILNNKLDNTLIDWCQNININKLSKLLSNLTQLVYDAKKRSENSDNWTQINVISTLIASLTGIVLTVVTIAGTMATLRAAAASIPAITGASTLSQSISSLTLRSHDLINTASQTVNTIIDVSQIAGNEIIPMESLNVLSQLSDSLSYYSTQSVENLPIENPEINVGLYDESVAFDGIKEKILDPKLQYLGTGIAAAGSGFVGTSDTKDTATMLVQKEKAIDIINNILRSTGVMDKIPETTESTTYTEEIDSTHFKSVFQDYLDDYMVNYIKVSDIIFKQASRLKNSLQSWQNAFCFFNFPNHLSCRLPNPNYPPVISIPTEQLHNMFSEDPIGLCYLFQNQLWCNWNKFLDIVSFTRSMAMNPLTCYWDQLSLKIKEIAEGIYQIGFRGGTGSCYNETAIIKI